MAVRIGWDKFEVALLIDACNQVLNKKIAKPEIVSRLSAALRNRAVEQGVEMDEIFRNENGISLQMAKMGYLLTEGKTGLPGASKLYAEIAELSKSDPANFAKLLVEAKEQIGVKETKVNMSNKEMFSQWLSVNTPKVFKPDAIIRALDEGGDYCKNHGLSKESLCDINDISKFSSITSRLLSMRIFRLTHRSTVSVLDKAVPLYRTFLKENVNAKENSPEVSTQQESAVKENNSPPEPAPKYEAPPINTPDKTNVSLADEETLSDKLYVALKEESRVNKYGTTLTYLATKTGAPEKTVKAILASAEWAKLEYGRYSFSENTNAGTMEYDFEFPKSLSFTKPIQVTYFEEIVSEASSWRQLFLDLLKILYEDYPGSFAEIAGVVYPPSAAPIIGKESDLSMFKTPGEFAGGLYVELNRSATDIVDTIKKLLDICNTDYENVVITYERKQTSQVEVQDSMKVSLNQTLEYLKTRYDVRLRYDRFANPDRYSNDMLYKVRNSKKDIMWVYYIHTKTAHYISVETEPEYLTDMKNEPKGFTRIQKRASHPCQKMFFEDYSEIRESLTDICDSIDMYFAASAPAQPEAERTKIYQKLYSISRVYDDPTGLSVDRIMPMLGSGIDERIVRDILDDASWATKLSDDVYSFSKKATTVVREPVTPYVATPGYITDTAFYKYLNEQVGMADAACRSYVSAIRTAEGYARDNGYVPGRLYECAPSDAVELMQKLLNDAEFMEFNTKQHNRIRAAFTKLSEMAGQTASSGRRAAHTPTVQPKVQLEDFDKERFEEALLRRYRNGMQFDSIDFENFREMYDMLFDEELTFDDAALEERLRYCGVIYKDRLFPAEGIIDSDTKEKMFSYIDNSFASGKKVIYYKAIYEDLSDVFASCFTLTDEKMLKAYIEYSADKDKYYFFSDYMSIEKHVTIDHNAEVEEFLLNAGKPMLVDDVCAALSHLPQDQVNRIISTDIRFLRNAKGEYFHVGIFEISDEELDCIAEIINGFIDENEYAIWTDIWNEIQDKMPVFLENNLYLSRLGVRSAIAPRYVGRFNFEGAVISLPKDRFAMRDVYKLYAKHHAEFTADDIYNLSKELDTAIYFDALAEVSVRVSNDLFVSKKQISFDVDAIDKAIGSFMAKDYIRIREIDSFLVFPNVGHEWNEYLLESFVASYSRKFALLSNGYSLNNVAGAIVKKDGKINEFVDVCAAALADSGISLKKTEALNYLADVNLITRRSYRDLDSAIRKATQIRGRKG